MTEDERQDLLGTVAEAHAGLSEATFKLRRELTPKDPALKTAIKAERETFRLKREILKLDLRESARSLAAAFSDPGRKGHRPRAALTRALP